MLNIDIEIIIMRSQIATIITNADLINTNKSNKDIVCARPTMDIKFLHLSRFGNIRGEITNIITNTAVIWKCWRR